MNAGYNQVIMWLSLITISAWIFILMAQ